MKKVLLFSLIISALLGIIYTFSVSPSVYWEDTGEFIITSKNLGIAHPPGHPLYIVLSHLFTINIPPEKVATGVNMFSVFCSFLALFFFSTLLYLLINPQKKVLFLPVFTATILLFGFSKTFWYYTEIAEVYTLHTLFSILIFISLLLFYKKDRRALLLFCFLFGLSLSNNITMIFLLPAFLLFIFLERKRIVKRFILPCILLFLLGISFYLYIPIRSRFNPLFDWGNAQTFNNLLSMGFAREFSKGFFAWEYAEKSFMPFAKQLLRNISYWSSIPILWGCYMLFKKERSLFILILSSIVFNVVFSFLTGKGPDFYAYFLPIMPLFFTLCGYGLMQILGAVKGKKFWISIVLFLILSFIPLFLNYKDNCRRNDYNALNYGHSLLFWLPDDAILLTENTNDFFILTYIKEIENKDHIEIYYIPLFNEEWYRKFIRAEGYDWEGRLTPLSFFRCSQKECFYTPGAGISLPVNHLQPQGPLFKIVEKRKELTPEDFSLPEPSDRKGKRRYAILYARFGEYYFKTTDYELSITAFENAKRYDPVNSAIYHNLSILYRKVNNFKEATFHQQRAEELGYKN